jgi:hypothetical protein
VVTIAYVLPIYHSALLPFLVKISFVPTLLWLTMSSAAPQWQIYCDWCRFCGSSCRCGGSNPRQVRHQHHPRAGGLPQTISDLDCPDRTPTTAGPGPVLRDHCLTHHHHRLPRGLARPPSQLLPPQPTTASKVPGCSHRDQRHRRKQTLKAGPGTVRSPSPV